MNAETKNYVPIEREDEDAAAVANQRLIAALAEYASESGGVFAGARLKWAKREVTLDEEPVDPNESFVLDPATIVKRHEHWRAKKLIETITALLGEKLPPLKTLQPPESEWERGADGKPKPPWSEVHYIAGFRKRDGLPIFFATSSNGGHQALRDLAKAVVQSKAGRSGKIPVATLGEELLSA